MRDLYWKRDKIGFFLFLAAAIKVSSYEKSNKEIFKYARYVRIIEFHIK